MEIVTKLENKKITIDHSLLFLALNQDPAHGQTMFTILQQIEQGKVRQAYLSSLSYAEIISGYKDEEVSKRVQLLLSHFPNLTIVPLDLEVAEQSANVQRKFDTSFYDAVLIATAMKMKSEMILTGVKSKITVPGIDWVNVE